VAVLAHRRPDRVALRAREAGDPVELRLNLPEDAGTSTVSRTTQTQAVLVSRP
jgi:hypothetical protein